MTENFDLTPRAASPDPKDDVTMSVSPICEKGGKKYAFVTFTSGRRSAEGRIPDCHIEKNDGFSPEEVSALEEYMKKELSTLKRTAASLNVFDAFRK